jgi:hypothetical protein
MLIITTIINKAELYCKCLNLKKGYCKFCLEQIETSLDYKFFITAFSISELLVNFIKNSFTQITTDQYSKLFKSVQDQVVKVKHDKSEVLLLPWESYFTCDAKFNLTGPNNSQYYIGKYNKNVFDLDVVNAYTSVAKNLLNKIYDFSKIQTITTNIKSEIKELNNKDIPFLVKVKFEYNKDYLYPAIASQNSSNAQLFLRSGISQYITSCEYNRLLDDKNILRLTPIIVKYYDAIEFDTPYQYLIIILHQLRMENIFKSDFVEAMLKKISNGIYGKMLQTGDKSTFSINTGLYENCHASSFTNSYLANLITGGCRCLVAEAIYQANLINLNVASSITDGLVIITEHDKTYIYDLIKKLDENKHIKKLVPSGNVFKLKHCGNIYIGIKKRLEVISEKNNENVINTVKQSIGQFSHEDNISVHDIHDIHINTDIVIKISRTLKPTMQEKIEKVSKKGKITSDKKTSIIPNLDPNRDRKTSCSDESTNYTTKAHDNFADYFVYGEYYKHKMDQYKCHNAGANYKKFKNGFLNDPAQRKKIDDFSILDNARLSGYARSHCIYTKLAYMVYYDQSKANKNKNNIDYSATYKISKSLGVLQKKGVKRKYSDSVISERINHKFKEKLKKDSLSTGNKPLSEVYITEKAMLKIMQDTIEHYAKKEHESNTKRKLILSFIKTTFKLIKKGINIIKLNLNYIINKDKLKDVFVKNKLYFSKLIFRPNKFRVFSP